MIKSILILALGSALLAPAQTMYVGGGPGAFSDAPHASIGLSVGVCTTDTCQDSIITSYFGRFSVQDLFKQKKPEIVYSTNVNWRHVARSVSWGEGGTANQARVDLFTLGTAGVAANQSATGFDGAIGGGLTYHPAKHPNWSASFVAQGDHASVNPGWRPNFFGQVGYTFRK